MDAAFVTRFAPSPTGYLHKGHAFSALTAFHAARDAGGRLLLRIEDIDAARRRPEYEAAILEDLGWLGLEWETPVRRQSDHIDDYQAALDQLRDRGLLYRCFRTRQEVLAAIASAPHGPVEAFAGAPLPPEAEADRLDAGEPFAWRLSLAAAREALGDAWDRLGYADMDEGLLRASPEIVGDVVLARKGLGVAYHLASVVDDALQGVTHVIRGEDLREAPHVQVPLQALLGLSTPVYRHHRLIVGPDGRRLAKRDKAQTLRELRAGGATPKDLRLELGFAE